RYRLVSALGQGGMATVFKAYDLELDLEVALKVFTLSTQDESLLARFKQELKLARSLNHPNVIRLFDLGIFAGHRYITMELLEGAVLTSLLGAPMEVRRGVGYLVQACDGLQAAHDQGIVHRDVKPDNFFVTWDGVVKVMDFGISKPRVATGLTQVGMVAGTPQYMSPEQINNFTTVTAATDLYALGVVAYEMFTGSPPFQHADLMPLLQMHVGQLPRPPRELVPALPKALEAIILTCLQKDPARRYASCADLSQALRAALGS
ncbi:MAG: serine/threonine protein kinase, partial [Deltaproteobacteria bacterium]|nr:serine/threonine protein kinase [Deltaproteobacteria bacterium]